MLKFKHLYGNTWPVGFIIQQLLESKLYGRLISVCTGIIDLIFNFNNICKVQNLPGSKPFGKKRLFCLLIARKWLLVSSAGGRYLVISLFTLKQSVSQKVIPWVCLSKSCGTKREKRESPEGQLRSCSLTSQHSSHSSGNQAKLNGFLKDNVAIPFYLTCHLLLILGFAIYSYCSFPTWVQVLKRIFPYHYNEDFFHINAARRQETNSSQPSALLPKAIPYIIARLRLQFKFKVLWHRESGQRNQRTYIASSFAYV